MIYIYIYIERERERERVKEREKEEEATGGEAKNVAERRHDTTQVLTVMMKFEDWCTLQFCYLQIGTVNIPVAQRMVDQHIGELFPANIPYICSCGVTAPVDLIPYWHNR